MYDVFLFTHCNDVLSLRETVSGSEHVVLIGRVLKGLHEVDLVRICVLDGCGIDLHLFYMQAEVICSLDVVDEDRHTS